MERVFPFDVIAHASMPGEVGELLRRVDGISMIPPYPWGHWLYARVFQHRCASLGGNLIELGVGLGGTSIFFGLLARNANKKVFSLDSFCGLPKPDDLRDNPYFQEGDYGASGAIPKGLLERFKDLVARFSLEDVIVPVPGFFEDSLPTLDPDQRFCFAHIDGDLYSSVLCALEHVYDRVVDGGVIVLDDFFHHSQGPLRAASEFFNSRKLSPTYHVVFPYSVFLFKRERSERQHVRSLDGNCYSFEWLKQDRYFIQVVEASLKSSASNKKAQDNCRLFLELLRSKERASSDVYIYWKSLDAYWDSICASVYGQPNRSAFTM